MHKRFDGQILNGNIDCKSNELEINSIRNIPTQSVWQSGQITEMLDQTEKAIEFHEGLVVTVRDSIPLILDHEELLKLNADIHKIQSILNNKD